jgi:hypothetical protein
MRVPAQPLSTPRSPEATTAATARGRTQPSSVTPTPAGTVQMSSTGAFVLSLRADAAQEKLRPDVVAQIKADLAAGRVGGQEDVEKTVDSLLLELT